MRLKSYRQNFILKKTKWDEGDISKEELIEFYEGHLEEFEEIILRYDELESPEGIQKFCRIVKIFI